jgi:hypothetical protein
MDEPDRIQQRACLSRVLTVDCVSAPGHRLDVRLDYDPEDPWALGVAFLGAGGEVLWMMARDLLRRGLTEPAGEGDVRVRPVAGSAGQACVLMEFCSPDGSLAIEAEGAAVADFLDRTLDAVPAGLEDQHLGLDDLIASLLG